MSPGSWNQMVTLFWAAVQAGQHTWHGDTRANPPAASATRWMNPPLLRPGKFLLVKVPSGEALLVCGDALGFLQQDGLSCARATGRDGMAPCTPTVPSATVPVGCPHRGAQPGTSLAASSTPAR